MAVDNTIIPSFLGAIPRGMQNVGESLFSNGLLRMGEVKKKILPNDPSSDTKQLIEYDVEVVHRTGYQASATTTYRCIAANGFGGVADRVHATFRADTKTEGESSTGNGSKVLILCINGEQTKAIILGGIDPEEVSHSEKGHHYIFEFNGAKVSVNSEGEIEILHRGPTNADGSIQEQYQDHEGTYVRFDKQGSLIVSGPGGEQYFKINHRDGQVELQADKKLLITSHGQTEIKSTDNTYVESENGIVQVLAGQGVHVGNATDKMILGSTYRAAEGAVNKTVAKSLQTAGAAFATASVALMTASGLNAFPMIGGIMAAPFFATAGLQLSTAGAALSAAGVAIEGLEAGAENYLSKKNRND